MGAGLSSGSASAQQPPEFTLDIALKESIPVREVIAAAQATGKVIQDVYHSQVSQRQIVLHQGDSPLMRAGQAARSVLLAELARCGPNLPILSRGCLMTPSATRSKLASFWLADPLGTSEDSSVVGLDDLSVSVALVHNSALVLGVVFSAASGECVWALRGNGAWCIKPDGSQHRLQCAQFSLSDASLKVVLSSRGKEADELTGMFGGAEVTHTLSGPLGLLKLASGAAHIYAGFVPLSEWEVAAADLIVREAGGAVLQAGAASEDWKDAMVRELPLVYNSEELHAPRIVAFGQRRADDESVVSTLLSNVFGAKSVRAVAS